MIISERGDSEFIELIDNENFPPNRNCSFRVSSIDPILWLVLFLFPVYHEVVGGEAKIVDEKENRKKDKTELDKENKHERIIVFSPLSVHIR